MCTPRRVRACSRNLLTSSGWSIRTWSLAASWLGKALPGQKGQGVVTSWKVLTSRWRPRVGKSVAYGAIFAGPALSSRSVLDRGRDLHQQARSVILGPVVDRSDRFLTKAFCNGGPFARKPPVQGLVPIWFHFCPIRGMSTQRSLEGGTVLREVRSGGDPLSSRGRQSSLSYLTELAAGRARQSQASRGGEPGKGGGRRSVGRRREHGRRDRACLRRDQSGRGQSRLGCCGS